MFLAIFLLKKKNIFHERFGFNFFQFLIRRKRARMHTRVTEGARRARHEKKETTRTATVNGLSRSTDFWRESN